VKIRLLLLAVLALAAPVARGGDWPTDYEQALATAKESKKCVLMNFTGSDWCGPCIMMHKLVFSKPAFTEFAEKYLTLLHVDFPMRHTLPDALKAQNDHLMEKYHVEQFPTVILLSPDGKVLGQLSGYSGEGPAEVIAWVEKLRPK
jgi:thioredoxin-related protein